MFASVLFSILTRRIISATFGCPIGLYVPSCFVVASVQSVPDKDRCILTGKKSDTLTRTKGKGNVFLQKNFFVTFRHENEDHGGPTGFWKLFCTIVLILGYEITESSGNK